MKYTVLIFIFSLILLLPAAAQERVDPNCYCLKLKPPVREHYFTYPESDSLPVTVRRDFQEQLDSFGDVLSQFSEPPLAGTQREIFRNVTFRPFTLQDMHIITLEKREHDVEVTLKFVFKKMKDSTVVVVKKIHSLEVWDQFLALATPYFLEQPTVKRSRVAVMDGSTTVFEGHISGRYHFLKRYVMSMSDPDLQQVDHFLFGLIGGFFEPDCKKELRGNGKK